MVHEVKPEVCTEEESEVDSKTLCSDAICYERQDGKWCTEAPKPTSCESNESTVPDAASCTSGSSICYELANGDWCTELPSACEAGELEIANEATCNSGSAVCYEISTGKWCTLVPTLCRPSETAVAEKNACIDGGVCYELQDQTWCTAEANSYFMLKDTTIDGCKTADPGSDIMWIELLNSEGVNLAWGGLLNSEEGQGDVVNEYIDATIVDGNPPSSLTKARESPNSSCSTRLS